MSSWDNIVWNLLDRVRYELSHLNSCSLTRRRPAGSPHRQTSASMSVVSGSVQHPQTKAKGESVAAGGDFEGSKLAARTRDG